MRKIEKPWGYEEIWAQTDKYVGKLMSIKSGHRMSLQYHNEKEETIYVMMGVLRVWSSENEDDYQDLYQGSVYHVKPKQIHRFGSAPISHGVTLMEVSTPELDDVVRLKDDYSR